MEAMDLQQTLLALGDETSRNLEFAHRDDVFVSYGEETITEHNLLEIRRWNPRITHIKTFHKQEEGRNGADWEWHIIGRVHTLKMRVQAKRVQRNNTLRIKHRVKSSGRQQRDLLIEAAELARMKPIYCIYSTEAQRAIWKQPMSTNGLGLFQSGCLVARANDVPETTTRLSAIEDKCVPWHFLCLPAEVARERRSDALRFAPANRLPRFPDQPYGRNDKTAGWDAPSINELNGERDERFDPTGVHETNERDLESLDSGTGYNSRARRREYSRLSEHGIHRWVVIDVRHEDPAENRNESYR